MAKKQFIKLSVCSITLWMLLSTMSPPVAYRYDQKNSSCVVVNVKRVPIPVVKKHEYQAVDAQWALAVNAVDTEWA